MSTDYPYPPFIDQQCRLLAVAFHASTPNDSTDPSQDPISWQPTPLHSMAAILTTLFVYSSDSSTVSDGLRLAVAMEVLSSERGDPIATTTVAVGDLAKELQSSLHRIVLDISQDSVLPLPDAIPILVFRDGITSCDSAFVSCVKTLGKEGARCAQLALEQAKNKAMTYQETGDHRDLLRPWLPTKSTKDTELFGRPSVVINLAKVLWIDVVRPRLEAQHARHSRPSILRFPNAPFATLAHGRAHGAQSTPEDRTIRLEPPPGYSLQFEFASAKATTRKDGSVGLASIFDDQDLQLYLTTWFLHHEQQLADGAFHASPDQVFSLIGIKKQLDAKPGRTYERWHSKHLNRLREFFDKAATTMVISVGEMSLGKPEPLINTIRVGNKVTGYAHSRLIKANLGSDFSQIPREVLALPARHIPWAIGIAIILRKTHVAATKRGTPPEQPLSAVLEQCGVDVRHGSRKDGLSFWAASAATLQEVARTSKVAEVAVIGTGPQASVRLIASEEEVRALQPLLAAAEIRAKQNSKQRTPR